MINKILTEEDEVFKLPSIDYFGDWEIVQKFIERRGNPPYSIDGDLDLRKYDIESLGNLQSVGGDLDLEGTKIESLGNLQSVGGYLNLYGTPLSKTIKPEDIKKQVNVGKDIYL